MGCGAIMELEATEYNEVTILANNTPVANGTASINGNRIGVAVTWLLPRQETMARF
jgi:flagellar motor switch protein FliN/FliY